MTAAWARYIAAGCVGASLMLAVMIATRIPELAGRGAGIVVRLALIWLEPDQGRDFWRVRRTPLPGHRCGTRPRSPGDVVSRLQIIMSKAPIWRTSGEPSRKHLIT